MTPEHTDELAASTARIEAANATLRRLEGEIRKVFIGQEDLVRGVLTGVLAGGNLLLEGAPGLGKTLLVKVLAQALALDFARIQFTPDLMPADITGGPTLHRDPSGHTELRFRRGPVFAHVVLADEINRGTPKTQSALLEAMEEHAVTVGGELRVLEEPFLVIATQNPVEMEGTYPLPEAQLDRFLLKLHVPFPPFEVLRRIGVETTGGARPSVEPVVDQAAVLDLQALARDILVGEPVADLAARITMATHPDSGHSPDLVRRFVRYGASPRATQALIRAGRAHALLEGRAWVAAEDLVAVALPVLRHRIFLGFEADLEGVQTDALVESVLNAASA